MALTSLLCFLGCVFCIILHYATVPLENSSLETLVQRPSFFFFSVLRRTFPKNQFQYLQDYLRLTAISYLVLYAVTLTLALDCQPHRLAVGLASSLCAAFVISLITRWIALKFPLGTAKVAAYFATPFALVAFPIIWPFVYIERKIFSPWRNNLKGPSRDKLKRRLLQILEDIEIKEVIDPRDKKFIRSLAKFGDLVAREIMVPRVDITCLPESMSIFDACHYFVRENYSRIPLYAKSLDHITGVILYKDLMEFCYEALKENNLDSLHTTTLHQLASPILYCPENKNISALFQEIRLQKIHAAIVVDEYGCTEGLITIEDIIEELIGSEILDEHDVEEEEAPFTRTKEGWIVDAKMSIIDAEREFGIDIPHHSEYETLGGFISYKLGSIPQQGTVLYQDNVTIKVLSSTDRHINKIRITKELVK